MYSFESSYAVLTYMPLASEQTPHIQHFQFSHPGWEDLNLQSYVMDMNRKVEWQ